MLGLFCLQTFKSLVSQWLLFLTFKPSGLTLDACTQKCDGGVASTCSQNTGRGRGGRVGPVLKIQLLLQLIFFFAACRCTGGRPAVNIPLFSPPDFSAEDATPICAATLVRLHSLWSSTEPGGLISLLVLLRWPQFIRITRLCSLLSPFNSEIYSYGLLLLANVGQGCGRTCPRGTSEGEESVVWSLTFCSDGHQLQICEQRLVSCFISEICGCVGGSRGELWLELSAAQPKNTILQRTPQHIR